MPAVPIIGMGASLVGGLLNKKKGAQQNTQSSEQIQFDPASMQRYQDLQNTGSGVLQDYMKDPWNAGFFNNQMARANEGVGQRAQTAIGNLTNAAMGLGGGAVSNPNAFLASQMNAIGRNASRERADSFSNLLINAENLRRGAAGAALSYQPLRTGTTGTQSTQQPQGSMLGNILGAGGDLLTGFGGGGGGYHSSGGWNNGVFDPNQIVV